MGAQDSDLTLRQVRDPIQVTAKLNANALDAETRLATLATSISTNENVVVPGTLAVTGVATFTAAPTLVSTNTPGAITLTMTNAPTAADDGKAVPVYIDVTIGATTYVVPAWPLTP
jgi:hypothetical protein